MGHNQMKLCSSKTKDHALETINKAMHNFMQTKDIERALVLAVERQKALVEIFEMTKEPNSLTVDLEKLATKTLDSICQEKTLLQAQTLEKRNDFVLRKTAIKAYLSPIAA